MEAQAVREPLGLLEQLDLRETTVATVVQERLDLLVQLDLREALA